MHKASCLCGSVALEIDAIVGDYVYCHCKSCRKSSGSAFAANVSVPIEACRITRGHSHMATYESSPGKMRHFCSNCGSPMFTKVGVNPEVVRLRLGSLDTDFDHHPAAHIFVSDKAAWEAIEGTLPQFDQWPSKDSVSINGSHQPDV